MHHKLDLSNIQADVLVHCGDFTDRGHMVEVKDFIRWFERQPFKYKILIAGNHELSFDDEWLELTEGFETIKDGCRYTLNKLVHENRNIIYLKDKACEIEGVKFYGSPFTLHCDSWAFQLHTEQQAEKCWSKIPSDTDVLITHSPPYGIMDEIKDGRYFGCPLLLHHCVNRVKPKLHVFGHIHEKHGIYESDGIKFINCACTDEDHEMINSGFVVEIEN